MSITALQEHIRKKKTPLALGLGPEANRLPAPVVKRFTDLYGESIMARSEALRYHGTQLMAQAAQRLPAVVMRADRYLLCGAMGLDVLSNLVHMARSQGLYAIVDARCADPAVWLGGEVNADAVTISPYYGTAAAGEDKALFALVRTAEPGAAEVQNLMAGDRRLFLAAGEQMARRGAGIMAQTDYSLDVPGAAAAVEGCLPSAGRLRRRSCQLCLRRFRPGGYGHRRQPAIRRGCAGGHGRCRPGDEALGHGGVTRIPTKEKL